MSKRSSAFGGGAYSEAMKTNNGSRRSIVGGLGGLGRVRSIELRCLKGVKCKPE